MDFLILSAGQLGKLVGEISTRSKKLKCIGYLDPNISLHGKNFYNIPVLGDDDLLDDYLSKNIKFVYPSMGDIQKRLDIINSCEMKGFKIPTIVDSTAFIANDAVIGDGSCILYNAIISPSVKIDKYTVVGSGVNILHDSNIGKNCIIGGGSTIGSSTKIGNNVSMGVGTVIASAASIEIGDNAKIAAGSVVLKSIKENSFVLGNPARVIEINESK